MNAHMPCSPPPPRSHSHSPLFSHRQPVGMDVKNNELCSPSMACCCFHPREVVVGICALCLKERLLVLASKQGLLSGNPTCGPRRAFPGSSSSGRSKLISIPIPKVFALGSFLHWPDLRSHRKTPDHPPPEDHIPSVDDSFISIKFGDDGSASWEKNKNNNKQSKDEERKGEASLGQRHSVVEHPTPRGALRWRRRLGHLLQVIWWRQSSKAEIGKRGWIRRRNAATKWERGRVSA